MHLQKNQILSQFVCQKSGNCCRASGWVRVTLPELIGMADALGVSPDTFRSEYVVTRNGWEFISTPSHRTRCFLDESDRCSLYDHRPKACRTYPDWPEIWDNEDALRDESTRCPGLARAIKTASL